MKIKNIGNEPLVNNTIIFEFDPNLEFLFSEPSIKLITIIKPYPIADTALCSQHWVFDEEEFAKPLGDALSERNTRPREAKKFEEK